MSETLETIRLLVESGQVRISMHGYDEMAEEGIRVKDVLGGVQEAKVVEDYPEFPKGPTVLVTAYRPDPRRWSADFRERAK